MKHSLACSFAVRVILLMDFSLVSCCNFFSQALISALCLAAVLGCLVVHIKFLCSASSAVLTGRLQSGQPLHASCKTLKCNHSNN